MSRCAVILQSLFRLDDREFVTELYREILERDPDPGGLAHHTSLLAGGLSRHDLVARFLVSEEFIARSGLRDTLPVQGTFWTTAEWWQSVMGCSEQAGYMEFPNEESVLVTQPQTIESREHPMFEIVRSCSRPMQQFVAFVPGGRVVGANGSVLTPDHKLLWDVSVEFVKPRVHTLHSKTELPMATYIPETVAVLTSDVSQNYYHWMFDVLIRVVLLRRSGMKIDRYVISRRKHQRFQDETLAAMGIPPDKVIDCTEGTHIRAKMLVVPSMAGYMGNPPRWLCRAFRQLMVEGPAPAAAGYDRIFISREDVNYRRVEHEDDLLDVLEGYGFRKVVLDRMSVLEQAALFSSAQVIVSPHGAGLANLVFCRPGTKLLELFAPEYVNACYWSLCEKAGIDYFYLVGNGAVPPENTNSQANIDVDFLSVVRLLDRMGVEPAGRTIADILQTAFQRDGFNYIKKLYRELLGREPDLPGLQDHLQALSTGKSKLATVESFMRSEEARELYRY